MFCNTNIGANRGARGRGSGFREIAVTRPMNQLGSLESWNTSDAYSGLSVTERVAFQRANTKRNFAGDTKPTLR